MTFQYSCPSKSQIAYMFIIAFEINTIKLDYFYNGSYSGGKLVSTWLPTSSYNFGVEFVIVSTGVYQVLLIKIY